MKKNIGAKLALYPTPLVVAGTMVNGKPNWTLVGHLGIIGHDRVMVSMSDSHYSNQGIRALKTLSINIVDEAMLKKADYAGCVSGANEDKSKLFAHHIADGGVPIIDAAPVSMACTVEDVYKTEGFESFICKIAATYAEESVLDDSGRLDYLGYGRILPFLNAANDIFTQMEIALPLPGQATTTIDNRLEKGVEAQAAIFGEGMKEAWKKGHINRWLAANCFGDFYTRTGLDLSQREMITFCFLMAQGGCEPQLIAHAKGNMNLGNDKDFLVRVVSQCLPYIGYPRSLNAMSCIQKAAEA